MNSSSRRISGLLFLVGGAISISLSSTIYAKAHNNIQVDNDLLIAQTHIHGKVDQHLDQRRVGTSNKLTFENPVLGSFLNKLYNDPSELSVASNSIKTKYEKILGLISKKLQGKSFQDKTSEVKSLSWAFKKSDINSCRDIGFTRPASNLFSSGTDSFPSIIKTFQCSPGNSIIVFLFGDDKNQGIYILDPFSQAGGTFRFPSHAGLVDSANRAALFNTSEKWMNIFIQYLKEFAEGKSSQPMPGPLERIGLKLKFCSIECVLKKRAYLQNSGVFVSPRSFLMTFNESDYPYGVPIVTYVKPGSIAAVDAFGDERFRVGDLIYAIGRYSLEDGRQVANTIDIIQTHLQSAEAPRLYRIRLEEGKVNISEDITDFDFYYWGEKAERERDSKANNEGQSLSKDDILKLKAERYNCHRNLQGSIDDMEVHKICSCTKELWTYYPMCKATGIIDEDF